MISKAEILSFADETGLTPYVVEKDFVLGWLLGAINANPVLSKSWVFKGGTCLKKCFIETYRFSEDLDFSLKDGKQINEEFLISQFTEISEWLYEASGIELPINKFIFEIYKNPRNHDSCQGRVYYKSYFATGKNSFPKIKLDLTADELLVLPSSRQKVFHPYSDAPPAGLFIDSYTYSEIFGEKIRALSERTRPRDLYDVINLFQNEPLPASAAIRNVLVQKCKFKGIKFPALEDIIAKRAGFLENWQPMLEHQLPFLPSLEIYWDKLPPFFEWLEGKNIAFKSALPNISLEGDLYRPSYGQLGIKSLSGGSLEIIRFAGNNRLCVDLEYTDNEGQKSTKSIEPYSLRKTKNGNIFLYAICAENGETITYTFNQINNATITNRPFVPKYKIEL